MIKEDNKYKQKYLEYINLKKKLNIKLEAFKIIIIYIIIGVLWILLSDKILVAIVDNKETFEQIQLYKGSFYVLFTATVFYFIIRNKINQYFVTISAIADAYEDLDATYNKLVEYEEKLSTQYQISEKIRQDLILSDQRFVLAVEGANDGIWDWDIINNNYFFSKNWCKAFGYLEGELKGNIETWKGLVHPDDIPVVLKKLELYFKKGEGIYDNTYRMRHKNGDYRWILSKGKGVWDDEGKAIRIAGSHTDITEQTQMSKKLYSLAYYDALTQIPNHVHLENQLNKYIIEEKEQSKFAFIYLDIDNFKHINETKGHSVGDTLIKSIANTLLSNVKAPDLIARIGGDEFVIVLFNINSKKEIIDKINKLLLHIRKSWILGSQDFFVSVSVGVAVFPEDGTNYAALLQRADAAMYYSKDSGKDQINFFTNEILSRTLKHVEMENQLRSAIDNNEFYLTYQPKFDLKNQKASGSEVLIRWNHPKSISVSPAEFIPFAEKTGYINKITYWVLNASFIQLNKWIKKGFNDLKIAINISAFCITKDSFINNLESLIKKHQIDTKHIEIEITETAIIRDLEKSIDVLKKIKDLGITIALDDFGSGYSSLTYLQKLPIDVLKIDSEFIKSIVDENKEYYILKSIIELAHYLNLKVVAEGVETKVQLKILKKYNCDLAQGYYFSKPLLAGEIEYCLN